MGLGNDMLQEALIDEAIERERARDDQMQHEVYDMWNAFYSIGGLNPELSTFMENVLLPKIERMIRNGH